MNITLTPEHEKFVREKLQDGHYKTIEELLVQAFHLLEEWDDLSPDAPLTANQQQELDRRLDRHEQNPTTGTTWEALKSRLLSNPT